MSFNHNFISLGRCCQWQSQLSHLHAVSNLLIALAYYSIPAFLIYFWRKEGEAGSSKSFVLLGTCCFGIGTTHLMAAWMPLPASYLPSISIEAVTAAISLWAVAKFVPLIPQILARFSPEEIAAANEAAFLNKIKTIEPAKTVDLSLENLAKSSQTESLEIKEQLLREIARRQQIEEQLQQANSRFQQLVESSPTGIVFWDEGGKITEANSALLDIIGYTQADLRSGKINWQAIARPELANTDDRPATEQQGDGENCQNLTASSLFPFTFDRPATEQERDAENSENLAASSLFPFTFDRPATEQERDAENSENLAASSLLPSSFDRPATEQERDAENSENLAASSLLPSSFDRPATEQERDAENSENLPGSSLLPSSFDRPATEQERDAENSENLPGSSLFPSTFDNLRELEFIRKDGRRIPIEIGPAISENQNSGAFFIRDLTQQKNIETALKDSEARFKAFQELSLDGFNVLRSIRDSSDKIADFEWEYINPAAAKIQGRSPAELIGKRLLEVFPGHKTSGLFDSYVRVAETGIPHDIEISYNSEGIVGWFRNMTVKLGDGIAISFSNISDRKQAEISLRGALQKLNSHFDNSPLATIEWDENLCCSRWSPAAEKIFGWQAAEVLGLHFSEWNSIAPEDRTSFSAGMYNLKTGTERCNILRCSNGRKHGTRVRCEWYNSAFYSESGQLLSVLSLVLEVTERFNFLEVLRQSEERFRIAAESASDLIYEWDINSGIMLWFGRADEHLGYERGEFPRTRQAWENILHPEDRARVAAAVEGYLKTCDGSDAPFLQEYRVMSRHGGTLHWVDRGKAVRDDLGNPCKWIGAIGDITARTQAESQRTLALAREQIARREAQASEQLYRVLAEAIPQIVWTAQPDGWVDYYNQRWFEYTGLTLEETQGWGWHSVLHPDDVQHSLECWNRVVQTGGTYEIEYRFKRASDGDYRWHLGRALPVLDAEGKIIKWFGTCTDIDDRHREAKTADFRARALALLSSSSLDMDAALQGLADLAVPGLADWCCVHLLRGDGSVVLQAVAHSDPEKVALLWQIDRRAPVDPQGRHGVAKVLRAGISKRYANIPESVLSTVVPDAELLEMLREDSPLSAMCVPLIARGRTLGAISLLCGNADRGFGAADLAVVEDLARDAAVAIDNARLYREAQEANRIKDEFLGTLSHELRTPLNAILGWAQMLQQRKLSPEKTAVGLETIERNSRLLTQTIDDLLEVSRIVSHNICLLRRPVDLARAIELAVAAVRADAEAKEIELVSVCCEGIRPVCGDAARLQRVVWNLLSNAVKFTPPGGRVEIRLSEVSGQTGLGNHAATAVDFVAISVSDTGIGISKEFLPFVFDRFRQADSTSTRYYGGLGLGLAIVRHLVELHGGTVWAESPGEGLGSSFYVRLPI